MLSLLKKMFLLQIDISHPLSWSKGKIMILYITFLNNFEIYFENLHFLLPLYYLKIYP